MRSSAHAPVWLPWLAAPAFMLLPLGGCGVAASLRQEAATAPAAAESSAEMVPIAAIVTALPVGR